MTSPLGRVLLCVAGLLGWAALAGGHPKPSAYPVSWELTFEHSKPKRILVTPAGQSQAKAYWYITYTVTNKGNQKQNFLPVFEMLTEDGVVTRSDDSIPNAVLDSIRAHEKKPKLQSVVEIAGTLLAGEDHAREGVAVWPEPQPEIGLFTIFVTGLSGEAVILEDAKAGEKKDEAKKPTILRKTLQLDYHVPGDAKYPGVDHVSEVEKQWIMR